MIKQPALAQEQYACVYVRLALLFFREVDMKVNTITVRGDRVTGWRC